jgi:hypothetical protein
MVWEFMITPLRPSLRHAALDFLRAAFGSWGAAAARPT